MRILANDERRGVLRAVTQSDRNGRYTLVTVAGPNRLIVYAPGLLLGKVRRQDKAGVFDLILKADPTPQELRLRTGRVLSFRLEDSLMPEAMPPRQARSAISVDYGIDSQLRALAAERAETLLLSRRSDSTPSPLPSSSAATLASGTRAPAAASPPAAR